MHSLNIHPQVVNRSKFDDYGFIFIFMHKKKKTPQYQTEKKMSAMISQ